MIQFNDDLIRIKLAVIGKSLVGKSALTSRFINDKFPIIHDTTIEDTYTVNTNINGFDCHVEILDTAGKDDYQYMLDNWIYFADGFILVFSLDDKSSFSTIKERILKIKSSKSKAPIIVLGNKCDLVETREIDYDEGYNFCKGSGVDYIECAAINRQNVNEAFMKILNRIVLNKTNTEQKIEKSSTKKIRFCCFS